MTLGGLAAGLVVALGAGTLAGLTVQREDATLAALYLISLAGGVLLVSVGGSSVDLMHVPFGTVLALDDAALILIALVTAATIATFALIWRGLVAECLDPLFLRPVSRLGPPVHLIFLVSVVLDLVGGFRALGTLLAVGLMMLPAAAARFWLTRVGPMCGLSIAIGAASSVAGLPAFYHAALPSGPAIILGAGAVYLASAVVAPRGLLATHPRPGRHRAA